MKSKFGAEEEMLSNKNERREFISSSLSFLRNNFDILLLKIWVRNNIILCEFSSNLAAHHHFHYISQNAAILRFIFDTEQKADYL